MASTKGVDPRRVTASFKFNGKKVSKVLKEYLESVTYTDVASGDADQLDIELQNVSMKWLDKWYPKKGNSVSGTLIFRNWEKQDKDLKVKCGSFILDDITFTGGPLKATFGCLAIPAARSFKARERTKTWKKVTIKEITAEIAKRYDLKYSYKADKIQIKSLEQSQQTDCSFLFNLCSDYGLAMKVYCGKIVIYDQTDLEKNKKVDTLYRKDFVDDNWTFNDTLYGTYTGAKMAYKSGDKEVSVYVGYVKEDSKKARTMKINDTADSKAEAQWKAAAKVNASNEQATTISGNIWPNPKICAGVTVGVKGLGKANGKYFVDKSTITVSDSGTTQSIEMHKCQKRLARK